MWVQRPSVGGADPNGLWDGWHVVPLTERGMVRGAGLVCFVVEVGSPGACREGVACPVAHTPFETKVEPKWVLTVKIRG